MGSSLDFVFFRRKLIMLMGPPLCGVPWPAVVRQPALSAEGVEEGPRCLESRDIVLFVKITGLYSANI